MKKENGFTLIELLAVIVILAILLGIATSAVSNYITNSKKNTFISNAKMYLEEARRNAVINGLPQDENEQYIIKVSELEMEKDNKKSVYGNNWVDEKSYVVIKNVGSNSAQEYAYSIVLEDEQGYCINLTLEDNLEPSEVKKGICDIESADEVGNEKVDVVGVRAVVKIEELALTNTNELMTDVDGNIHYYGATPNNYVTFNGETAGWRILGVYSVDGEKRIKLVRSTPIGNYSWDNKNTSTGAASDSGSKDWETSRLMKLLNPGYGSETVGGSLYWNRGSGDCYAGINNATTPCDFKSTGLTSEAKNMIVKSTFNIGGFNDSKLTASEMIAKEKERTWEGYVGVLNASDYGYASNLSSCTKTLWYYDNANCKSTNYLFNSSYNQWLLQSATNSTDYAFARASYGYVDYCVPFSPLGINPVVYLDTNVLVVGTGDGSSNNPFTLSK